MKNGLLVLIIQTINKK